VGELLTATQTLHNSSSARLVRKGMAGVQTSTSYKDFMGDAICLLNFLKPAILNPALAPSKRHHNNK
jgi:hypothetical protein